MNYEKSYINFVFAFSHSMAMAPILQEAEVLMVSPNSTNPSVTLIGDYIFRVCYLDSFQGAAMADFARNDLNAETSIIITMAGDLFSMGLGSYIWIMLLIEIEKRKISIKIAVAGDQLNIEYSDNGAGMTEEVRSRIFEPFYTTKRGNF